MAWSSWPASCLLCCCMLTNIQQKIRAQERAGYHTYHGNSTLVGLASWCKWANFSQNGGESPVVNHFQSSTAAIVSNPRCPNPTSFYSMSKQAEASGSAYSLVFL
ncbi:hypothetical protein Gogos_021141 [Gossypium gossypioides]|uniref:Secreted protein n=1 Tax=Gossypium gossypioides TaxID=34282 RepID=A0A7J9D468_GOSGO|nr:hypothetical protein [Gossypium gossypioides]